MNKQLIFFFFFAILSCKSAPKDYNETLLNNLFSAAALDTNSSFYCNINYDTLDNLKEINSNYHVLFDTGFIQSIEPNKLCIWKCFQLENQKAIIITNSGYDGLLIVYLFVENKAIHKLSFVYIIGLFYQLHNKSLIETSQISFYRDSILITKHLENCDYHIDSEKGKCFDSTTIKKYKL